MKRNKVSTFEPEELDACRQTDRQTDIHTNRQIYIQTVVYNYVDLHNDEHEGNKDMQVPSHTHMQAHSPKITLLPLRNDTF